MAALPSRAGRGRARGGAGSSCALALAADRADARAAGARRRAAARRARPTTRPPRRRSSSARSSTSTRASRPTARVACATCHDPRHGFADPRGKPTSAGVGGALGTRNSPTALNAAFLASQFWDGRAATLEEQAVQPLDQSDRARLPGPRGGGREARARSPTTRRSSRPPSAARRSRIAARRPGDRELRAHAAQPRRADRPLPGGRREGHLRRPRSAAGSSTTARRAATPATGASTCCRSSPTTCSTTSASACSASTSPRSRARRPRPSQAGESIDELALTDAEASELGRFLVTREQKDLGAFKTPQLRNVALTAPYMHDGSEATLRRRDRVLRPRRQRQPVPRRRHAPARLSRTRRRRISSR